MLVKKDEKEASAKTKCAIAILGSEGREFEFR
jgi:hypothetical protein